MVSTLFQPDNILFDCTKVFAGEGDESQAQSGADEISVEAKRENSALNVMLRENNHALYKGGDQDASVAETLANLEEFRKSIITDNELRRRLKARHHTSIAAYKSFARYHRGKLLLSYTNFVEGFKRSKLPHFEAQMRRLFMIMRDSTAHPGLISYKEFSRMMQPNKEF